MKAIEVSDRARAELRAEYEATLSNCRRKKTAWAVIGGLCFGLAVGMGILLHQSSTQAPWSNQRPPVDTKLRAVTYAYFGKDGKWHSYDNGEVIEVQQWKW